MNDLKCDNVLAYLPSAHTIFTTVELTANPAYDPEANKSGWELFWKDVASLFNGMSNETKIALGLIFLLAACLIAAATAFYIGGTSIAMLVAMAEVAVSFMIGVATTAAVSAVAQR